MRQDKFSKERLIVYAFGLIPVIWIALVLAPYVKDGLPGIIENFAGAMEQPWNISLCEDSLKTVLIFVGAYAMGLAVYLSSA